MHVIPAFDAVLYANDLRVITEFYAALLDTTPIEEASTHVVLPVGACRLWLHAIPAAYASTMHIAQPPALREDASIKLSFTVPSLATARETVTAHGGGTAAPERGWELNGTWHLDAWDPEGNVLQLRAPANLQPAPTC